MESLVASSNTSVGIPNVPTHVTSSKLLASTAALTAFLKPPFPLCAGSTVHSAFENSSDWSLIDPRRLGGCIGRGAPETAWISGSFLVPALAFKIDTGGGDGAREAGWVSWRANPGRALGIANPPAVGAPTPPAAAADPMTAFKKNWSPASSDGGVGGGVDCLDPKFDANDAIRFGIAGFWSDFLICGAFVAGLLDSVSPTAKFIVYGSDLPQHPLIRIKLSMRPKKWPGCISQGGDKESHIVWNCVLVERKLYYCLSTFSKLSCKDDTRKLLSMYVWM